jgi:hypothetical protein
MVEGLRLEIPLTLIVHIETKNVMALFQTSAGAAWIRDAATFSP